MTRPWYTEASAHMWRYFVRRIDQTEIECGEANRMQYEACRRAYEALDGAERELVREYYQNASEGGFCAINGYMQEHGIKIGYAANVIRRANWLVAVERGLIDRRDSRNGYDGDACTGINNRNRYDGGMGTNRVRAEPVGCT